MTASIRAELAAISAALHTTESDGSDVRSYVGVGRLLAVVSDLNAAVESLTPAAVPTKEPLTYGWVLSEDKSVASIDGARYVPEARAVAAEERAEEATKLLAVSAKEDALWTQAVNEQLTRAGVGHLTMVDAVASLRSRAERAETERDELKASLATSRGIVDEATAGALAAIGERDALRKELTETKGRIAADQWVAAQLVVDLRSQLATAVRERDEARASEQSALNRATAAAFNERVAESLIEQWRPVVEAAKAWRAITPQQSLGTLRSLAVAVDALTAQPEGEAKRYRGEVWGYSSNERPESWDGSCKTREEAITEGRANFGDTETFWITSGEWCDVADFFEADDAIERAQELAHDNACEDAEIDVREGGKEALGALLTGWANRYAVLRAWTQTGDAEKIEPTAKGAETPAEVVKRLGIDVPKWAAEIRSKVAALPVCSCGANAVCAGLNGPPPHAPDCAAFPRVVTNTVEYRGVAVPVEPPRERPHLINGEFQSDKYPTTPRGKVPLSVRDTTAQDLLWQYAQRRRSVDAEFAEDLETALQTAGYEPPREAELTLLPWDEEDQRLAMDGHQEWRPKQEPSEIDADFLDKVMRLGKADRGKAESATRRREVAMKMASRIESALWWCGKENVFHRVTPTGYDVRARFPDHESAGTADIVCGAATLDEAGEAVAREFARRLRKRAEGLENQADLIEEKLNQPKVPQ